MTDWLKPGSPLPQSLARFLFLEDAVPGRRILEVGGGDSGLAAALLELGARRVVCAVDDPDVVLRLRERHAGPGIDYRMIRDGVLPGDDGAFDLVIDFSLPQALARGDAWRLLDINRVLSEDGFALSALANPEVTGLPGMFPTGDVQELGYRPFAELLYENFDVVQTYFQSLLLGYFFGAFDVDPGSDGIAPNTELMGGNAEPASYYLFAFGHAVPIIEDVSLVQLPLAGMIEVAEEESRLLEVPADGDLLAQPGPDGATAQLSSQVPAQVPAQVPSQLPSPSRAPEFSTEPEFSTKDKEERPTSEAQELAAITADLDSEPELTAFNPSPEVENLHAELHARDAALSALAERLPALQTQVQGLVSELILSSEDRDRYRVALEQVHVAVDARDAHLQATVAEIQRLRERCHELEALHQQALATPTTDPAEKAALEEALLNARSQLKAWASDLSSAHAALEQSQADASHAAQAHKEEQRRQADREQGLRQEAQAALEKAQAALEKTQAAHAQTHTAFEQATRERDALQQAAEELPLLQTHLTERDQAIKDLEDTIRRAEEDRDRLLDESKAFAGERLKLADGVNQLIAERAELRQKLDALSTQKEALSTQKEALSTQKESLVSALKKSRAALDETRVQKVSAEQEADNRVSAEAALKASQGRIAALESQLGELTELLDARHAAHADLEQNTQTAQKQLEDLKQRAQQTDDRLKAAQAKLTERGQELGAAREAFSEAASQRDTLQQVVTARDRNLVSLREELEEAVRASEASHHERIEHQQKRADLERELSELARARTTEREKAVELSRATAQAQQARDQAVAVSQQRADEIERLQLASKAAEVQAEEAGGEVTTLAQQLNKVSEQLAEAEGALEAGNRLLAQQGQHLDEVPRLRGQLSAQEERISKLEGEKVSVVSALEVAEGELNEKRQRFQELEQVLERGQATLDLERAEHEKTRDALAETTQSAEALSDREDALTRELDAQRRATDCLSAREEELENAAASGEQARQRAEAYGALLQGTLDEAQACLTQERARGDLLSDNLAEAQAALMFERARAESFRSQLEGLRLQTQADETQSAMLSAQLIEAQDMLVGMSTRAHLLDAQLDEAQKAAQLEALESELTQDVLQEAQRTLIQERARGDMLTAQLGEAQRTLADGEARVALVAAQLEESQAEGSLVMSQASAQNLAFNAAEASLLEEWKRGEQMSAQVKNMEASLADGRTQANLHAALLHEAQDEATTALSRAGMLEAQLDDARQRFRAAYRENDAVLVAARDAGIAEVKSARAELQTLEQQLSEEADRKLADASLLRAEVDTAREQLEIAHEMEQQGLEQRQSLTKKLDELDIELDAAEKRGEKWEMRALEAEGAVDRELAGAAQQSAALREELDTMRQERDAVQAAIDEQKERAAQEEAARQTEAANASETASLNEKTVTELRAQSDDLKTAIADLRTTVADLEQKLAAVTAERDAVREEAEKEATVDEDVSAGQAEALSTLTSELARKDDALQKAKARAELLEMDLTRATAEAESERGSGASARAEIEELRAELAIVGEQLQESATAATENLAGASVDSEAATQVAALEKQIEMLRADLAEKNDRINRLTQRLVNVEGL